MYFVLTFTSHFENVKPYLLTHRVVEWSGQALHVDSEVEVRLPTPTFHSKAMVAWGKYGVFKDIAHCFWTLILAAIGGVAATWLQRPKAINKSKDQL